MRPNMSLTNSAQNKKFTAVEGTSIDKKFQARQFYSGETKPTRSFLGARSFFSKAFGTGKYARAAAAADFKSNADLAFASTEFKDRKSSLVRRSPDADKPAQVREYADTRPFLAKGTRQEQLNRQPRPMTIDEVRELLNTNR